jgi:hypothetical protein
MEMAMAMETPREMPQPEPEPEPEPRQQPRQRQPPRGPERRTAEQRTIAALRAQLHVVGLTQVTDTDAPATGAAVPAATAATTTPASGLWDRLKSAQLVKAQLASMSQLRELHDRIARKDAVIAARDRRVAELLLLLEARDGELARLTQQVQQLQAQLALVRPSGPARVTRDASGLAMDDGWGARFELGSRVERQDGEFFVAACCQKRWTHMSQFEAERRTEWRFLTNLGRVGTGTTHHHRGQHGEVSMECRCGELGGAALQLTDEYLELAGLMQGVVKAVHPEIFVGEAYDETGDMLGGLAAIFSKYHRAVARQAEGLQQLEQLPGLSRAAAKGLQSPAGNGDTGSARVPKVRIRPGSPVGI